MIKNPWPVIIGFLFILVCWTGCASTSSSKTKNTASATSSEASDTSISQKKEDIRKLIIVSGNADSILLSLQQFYDNQLTLIIQRNRPDLSQETLKLLRQQWRDEIKRIVEEPGGLLDY
ncbi:MAG: hypothetical protein HKO79_09680, partial [Desulfobacterales bacterium]|nr:hypothetical protein [Desulfobacterales bacterium]